MQKVSRRLFLRNAALTGASMATPGMVYFEELMKAFHGVRRRYFDMKPKQQLPLSFEEWLDAIGLGDLLSPHMRMVLKVKDPILWGRIESRQIRGFSHTAGKPFVLPRGVEIVSIDCGDIDA